MTEDARFEEGGERPLRLKALDAEDLRVVSSLAQDAVLPAAEIVWDRRHRRFALLLNRFRWEDADRAGRGRRAYERVRAILSIEDVVKVQTQGVDLTDKDLVLSLLSVDFEPRETPSGRIVLTLAGDGAIAVEVEALEVMLRDVTRPYRAPSGKIPSHDEDDLPGDPGPGGRAG